MTRRGRPRIGTGAVYVRGDTATWERLAGDRGQSVSAFCRDGVEAWRRLSERTPIGMTVDEYLARALTALEVTSEMIAMLAGAAAERALLSWEDRALRRLDPVGWERLSRDRDLTAPQEESDR